MKSSYRQKSILIVALYRNLECFICRKTMRGNNLKRYYKTKHKIFDIGLTVEVEAKSRVGESSSTDNNLKLGKEISSSSSSSFSSSSSLDPIKSINFKLQSKSQVSGYYHIWKNQISLDQASIWKSELWCHHP